jgi:cell division septation protein DedD
VAHQVPDDGFHEIQLNGKQLVFLFMAATVVSVVIFLCGVLVGRGVRSVRGGVADLTPLSTVSDASPQQSAPALLQTPAGSDPTRAAAPPAVDDLTYFNRLEASSATKEQLKPAPDPAATRAAAPAQAPPASPVKEVTQSPALPAADSAPPEPAGPGFAVQIAALNVRSEADAIAKRLSTKGYAAYVLTPTDGTPAVYRVRIGKFPTRHEAETVAAKLQKEEQFKPWVTR